MTQKAEIAAVEAAKSAAARGASPEEQAGTNDAKPQSWSVGFQPTRQWFAEDWECVPAKVFNIFTLSIRHLKRLLRKQWYGLVLSHHTPMEKEFILDS